MLSSLQRLAHASLVRERQVRAARGTRRSALSAFGGRRVAEAPLRIQVAGVVERQREVTAGADKNMRPGREQSNLGAQISMRARFHQRSAWLAFELVSSLSYSRDIGTPALTI